MTVTIHDEECAAIADGFARALKPGPHGDPIIESQDGGTFIVRGSETGRRFRITVEELGGAANCATEGCNSTVYWHGDDKRKGPRRCSLCEMRRLNAALIDDSENEPPDFTVTEDDLGF